MSTQQQQEHKKKMTDSLGYIKYDMVGAQDGEYDAGDIEWSVRGYYKRGGDVLIADDYYESFKTEEEARVFYNSITKTVCDAGKVLYKEPYEQAMILEEENYDEEVEEEEEACLPDRCEGGSNGKCSLDKCYYEDEEEEEEEEEFYEVSCAENPDIEYFKTLIEAKQFCDKCEDLNYGLIMLCDKNKNRIGDWGDYD